MKKITPIGNNVLLTSRGIKTDAGGVEIPEQYLRDSNVCKTESGETVVARDNRGHYLPNHQRIVDFSDIMAKMEDDEVKPIGEYVLLRKCIDPEEELIITSLSRNKSDFAEILAAGPDTVLEPYIGWMAHVDHTNISLQKVEETAADWLAHQEAINMIVKTED